MNGDSTIRRLRELQASQPVDTTLRNLLELLQAKLQLSARLPVLVFEAEQDGDHACAGLFRALVASEKSEIAELLEGLRTLLDARRQQLTTHPPA